MLCLTDSLRTILVYEITSLRVLVATSIAFPPRATRGASRVRQVARSGVFPFFLFFKGMSASKKQARAPQKRGTSASKKEARAPQKSHDSAFSRFSVFSVFRGTSASKKEARV